MNFYARRSSRSASFFKKDTLGVCAVVAFCAICITVGLHAANGRDSALQSVSFRLQELEKEKQIAIEKREELMACLQSESDPAWIELVLMKELGVVPDGWIKVHFQ